MIERIEQRGSKDCVVAVCAMVLGRPYEEVRAQFPAEIRRGFTELHADNVLIENGYAVARKYHANCAAGTKRKPWPPEPWADVHIAHVENGEGIHAVVVLGDGTVIDPDPARPEPMRLESYEKVLFVAAVVPLARNALWNNAIRAAIRMANRLGGDRPRLPHRREFNRHDRGDATIRAMHTRARTIVAGLRTLLR